MTRIREQLHHGLMFSPEDLPGILKEAYNDTDPGGLVSRLTNRMREIVDRRAVAPQPPTSTTEIIDKLLIPTKPQPPNSLSLARNLSKQFSPGADTHAQLLVNFAPKLKENFYTALSNAKLNTAPLQLEAVYVMRVSAPIFGATAPLQTSYVPNERGIPTPSQGEWRKASDEAGDAISWTRSTPQLCRVHQPLSRSPIRKLTRPEWRC